MRRIFNDRARLVIYLEAQQLEAITQAAREEGKPMLELVREVIAANFPLEEESHGHG
jgi:hypothetical protein